MNKNVLLAGLVLAVLTAEAHADGALRVKCFDDAEGAEVYINGEFKTNCPGSVFVPAGDVRVLIRKTTDADHERIFVQQMRIGEGAVATVEAKLAAPQLTDEANKRKQIADSKQILLKAQNGDIAAMREISDRYDKGLGVEASDALASEWRQKAEAATASKLLKEAEGGKLESMEAIAIRYETGNGVVKDQAKADTWRSKRSSAIQAQQAKQREDAKQARINAIEENKYSFSKRYLGVMFMQNDMDGRPEGNISSATTFTAYCPALLPVSLLSDLSMIPSKNSDIEQIRKEAVVLPAKWGSPDSMIARSFDSTHQVAINDTQR